MSSFIVDTKVLQTLVNKAVKGAANNKFNTITNLMNVVVNGNRISITTTGNDTYLTVSDAIISGEDTSFTVVVDLFSKLISKTSVENIKISATEDVITVTGNGTYKLPIKLDVDGKPIKYPEHVIEDPEYSGTIALDTVRSVIIHNKPSLSITNDAPYLMGYRFTPSKVISADTFNICLNTSTTFGSDILISPAVLDLLSICEDESIEYKIKGREIIFENDSMKLYATAMNGIEEYPISDIEEIDKVQYTSNCTLSKQAMLNSLDRLSLFIKDNEKNGVYLTFTKNNVKIESVNRNGIESIDYQGINNFNDFVCFIGVENLRKQVTARAGESFNLYFGGSADTVAIKDGGVTQIIALLDMQNEEE